MILYFIFGVIEKGFCSICIYLYFLRYSHIFIIDNTLVLCAVHIIRNTNKHFKIETIYNIKQEQIIYIYRTREILRVYLKYVGQMLYI